MKTKANSNSQPDRLLTTDSFTQIRWSIEQNDKTSEDADAIESWDYSYANCASDSYADLVEGIIRTKYTAAEVEAILANYAKKTSVLEYLKFQAWRSFAKQVAADEDETEQQVYALIMPLSFCLAGGKYETLADRILKVGSSYEIDSSGDTEMVTVYVGEVFDDDSEVLAADEDVSIEIIDLLDEAV